jgi:hypothetical protein
MKDKKGNITLFVFLLIAILVYFLSRGMVDDAKEDALATLAERVEPSEEFTSNLFEVKILDTMDSVKKKFGNRLIEQDNKMFVMKRNVYGREALVNFLFNEDDSKLDMIICYFAESYNKETTYEGLLPLYNEVQIDLNNDIGDMGEIKPVDDLIHGSYKLVGGVRIDHKLSKVGDFTTEIISVYLSNE